MNYSKKMLLNQGASSGENLVIKAKTNTWLHIQFNEDISSELGNTLPYPHHHYIKNNSIVYCWLIDGFFNTKKNIEFLNDIIARFKITFIDSKYLKHSEDLKSNITPIRLKQFQNLKSKAKEIVKEKYQRAETHQDYVFWCIKLYCEDLIKQDGLIIYDSLERWAFENFIDHCKDKSTLRAKCRGTYNWYFERNWQIGRANKKYNNLKNYWEQTMATRKDHMIQVNKNKADVTKRKVLNCVTGQMKDLYKNKNGKWNVSKIAKESGTSRNTVYKYLKEIENEK